ncbi:hypothetical protein Tco_1560934 [Tanacetum coccineum]
MCEVISKFDGPHTPNATKLFNVIKEKVAQYKVEWNRDDKYQVTGPRGDQKQEKETAAQGKSSSQPPLVSSLARPSQGIVIRDSPSANTRSSRLQVSSQLVAAKKAGKGKLTAKEKAKQMMD